MIVRNTVITCDFCKKEITTHYVSYAIEHIGDYATWEGARYHYDFCDDDHLRQWLSKNRRERCY